MPERRSTRKFVESVSLPNPPKQRTRRATRRQQLLANISFEDKSPENSPYKPTTARKSIKPSAQNNNLVLARQALQTSSIPDSLPCREQQFHELYSFCEDRMVSKTSGVLYVAGVPGTGKTATMREVLKTLSEQVNVGEIDDFNTAWVNGMNLATPKNVFVDIYRQFLAEENIVKLPSPEECKKQLSKYFGSKTEDDISLFDNRRVGSITDTSPRRSVSNI